MLCEVAAGKATNAAVKNFAARMVRDHRWSFRSPR